jgi:hypothetical protein
MNVDTVKDKSSVHSLHAELLGLKGSWKISSITLDAKNQTVIIQVEMPADARVECPECGNLCWISDFKDEQEWAHLSLLTYKAVIRCCMPRCDCPEHGVLRVAAPWAPRTSQISRETASETEGEDHETTL